jgi:hypothetical protein
LPEKQDSTRLQCEEGLAEGLQAGILALLKLKFKKVSSRDARKLRSVREVERLHDLLRAVTRAESLDEVLALLR